MGLTSAREDTAHQADKVAEWLRRWTANPLCSARVGSNPILVVLFFFLFTSRSDLLLDSDFPSPHYKEECAGIPAPPFEEFDPEAATTDDSEIDPVLELYISSPSSPLASEAVGPLPLLPPPITSPGREMMDGELMDEELMKEQSSEGELNGGTSYNCFRGKNYCKCYVTLVFLQ